MTRNVATVAALTLLYAFVLASFAPLDLLFGAVLSTTLVFFSRSFVFANRRDGGPSLPRRVVAFFPFASVVFGEILKGTWEVALVTVHIRPLERPGIVEVPIGERTSAGVAAWAVVTGLPPGSFFVDVDLERNVALIHVMDAGDPESYRRRQEEFYRRYQRGVFP